MDIEVERVSSDLGRQVWVFRPLGFPSVLFAEYRYEVRPTKRHKWRVAKLWNRNGMRNRSVLESIRLQRSDVPMLEDVKDEALARAAGQLVIVDDIPSATRG